MSLEALCERSPGSGSGPRLKVAIIGWPRKSSHILSATAEPKVAELIAAVTVLKEPFNKIRFVGILLIVGGGILVQSTRG